MKKFKPVTKIVLKATLLIGMTFASTMSFAQELEKQPTAGNGSCGYVIKGSKKGLMGPKFVIKPVYTCSSKDFDEQAGIAIVQGKESNLWGAINKTGEVVIPLEYKEELFLKNGKIVAQKDGNKGLLGTDGKTIIPFEYNALVDNSSNKTHALLAKKNSKWGLIDYTGKVLVPIEYEQIRDVPLTPSNGSKHFNLKQNGKYGLYGLDEGKLLTEVKYDNQLMFTTINTPIVYKTERDGGAYEVSEKGVETYVGAASSGSSSPSSSSSSSSSSSKTDNKKVDSKEKKEKPAKEMKTYTCRYCGKSVQSNTGAPGLSGCSVKNPGGTHNHGWSQK
ncbi:MAG: WG repeat-containing protein [Chitinophagaceae bacterium]|nr:MAG: KWG repeat-containing protein [Bacteroidetes bacterium OLB11]MCC6447939.1 WG repeat-containing protein [Chitinophagaceae bacterium]HMN32900.1 WG repeat-containing protein [Chitinophagaceae bacterium]